MTNNEQLAYTIREMYRLVGQYSGDVARYNLDSIYKVFHFVRDIPYRRDIDSCGVIECLKRPAFTIFEGDCDDKSIFAGAALSLLRIPWRFITVSRRRDGEMQHVYLEIFFDGLWRPFDATYSTNSIFVARPYTRKIIWANPMRYDNTQMNVSTLEGLGETPIIVLGDLDAILKKVQDIPLIGSLFKGKTKTQTYDESVTQQREVFANVVKIYNGLPSKDAKAYMLGLCKTFFENWIMPDLGHRWNNAISNAFSQKWSVSPDWVDPAFRCGTYVSIPLFYFLAMDDVELLQTDLKVWFSDPVTRIIWMPLNDYLVTNYGSGLSDNPITPGASASMSPIGVLLLGGLAIAMMTGMGKRR